MSVQTLASMTIVLGPAAVISALCSASVPDAEITLSGVSSASSSKPSVLRSSASCASVNSTFDPSLWIGAPWIRATALAAVTGLAGDRGVGGGAAGGVIGSGFGLRGGSADRNADSAAPAKIMRLGAALAAGSVSVSFGGASTYSMSTSVGSEKTMFLPSIANGTR